MKERWAQWRTEDPGYSPYKKHQDKLSEMEKGAATDSDFEKVMKALIAEKEQEKESPARPKLEIRPQLGPQEKFLSSSADIAIYGGAAYAGKTFALVMEPLRHYENGLFNAVIFRREATQVRNPGGMWDESRSLYQPFKVHSVESVLEHRFPSGALVKFAHLEHEDSKYSWDGSQITLLAFDQLEHFTRSQFFYMLSRNRNMGDSGIAPYIRATCNPDADSWLAEFITWWINQETGYPIPERAGELRWFIRVDEDVVWADSKEELEEKYGAECMPKSVTFVPGSIYDNKIGMQRDPGYLANLKAMNAVERERLLGGNWKIRPSAGLLFQRQWCPTLDIAPYGVFEAIVRGWDLAGTQKTESNSPAWTVGVKLGRYKGSRRYCVLDVRRAQVSPAKVEELILNTARMDGRSVTVALRQDPGQAGKSQVSTLVRILSGFVVKSSLESGDKATRFAPFSAQAEHGNVDVFRFAAYDAYCTSLESFPDAQTKDDADATSTAFESLVQAYGPVDVARGAEVSDSLVLQSANDGAPWGMYGNA